jgi:hypothetical protein
LIFNKILEYYIHLVWDCRQNPQTLNLNLML